MSDDKLLGEVRRVIRNLARPTPEDSYRAGLDCGLNGANEQNCHFAFFRTPEHTAQWEKGKRDATV